MRLSDTATGDYDPLFKLSLMGMVARELGMLAMLWEFQDERLYFTGSEQALGPLSACMTLEEFRACVHPDDVTALDACLACCQDEALCQSLDTGMAANDGRANSFAANASLRLRLVGEGLSWQHLDCRLRVSERDEHDQPARLVGMLMPASNDLPAGPRQ